MNLHCERIKEKVNTASVNFFKTQRIIKEKNEKLEKKLSIGNDYLLSMYKRELR